MTASSAELHFRETMIGSAASPRWADQDFGWDVEFLMEIANHIEGEWALALHNLINARALSNDSDQGASVFALLFQSKLDRLDGAWEVDGIVPAFVSLDERSQDVQLIASRGPFRRIPQPFDPAQRTLVICFTSNRFNVHISPSSHQCGRNPRVSRST